MEQEIGLHARRRGSAGEDKDPIFGHFNPNAKALCPGLARMF